MPDWVADKKRRAETIRAAQADLEAEAKAEGRKKRGRLAAPPSDKPDPKAQKNFTDPESRIMKTKDGFIQGYNAQAAVDATAQVIVAHDLDAKQNDQHQLTPLVDAVTANMGKKAEQISIDAGYCSNAKLGALEERRIVAYVAPGRAKHAMGLVVRFCPLRVERQNRRLRRLPYRGRYSKGFRHTLHGASRPLTMALAMTTRTTSMAIVIRIKICRGKPLGAGLPRDNQRESPASIRMRIAGVLV
jgi:hypothetical protein